MTPQNHDVFLGPRGRAPADGAEVLSRLRGSEPCRVSTVCEEEGPSLGNLSIPRPKRSDGETRNTTRRIGGKIAERPNQKQVLI